jgi:hypothetical protein
MGSIPLLRAYHREHLYEYDISDRHTGCTFGGPCSSPIYGDIRNVEYLHQVAMIAGTQRPDYASKYLQNLPLLYGIRFSGCDLSYRLVSGTLPHDRREILYRGIEILELSPDEPDDDWPYPNYPIYLPYWPIEVKVSRPCHWKEFAEEIFDARENPPSQLIFAMSPPTNLGISLWGLDGDMEGVQIIWEVDTDTNHVLVTNRST